jgi:hypothetical protein
LWGEAQKGGRPKRNKQNKQTNKQTNKKPNTFSFGMRAKGGVCNQEAKISCTFTFATAKLERQEACACGEMSMEWLKLNEANSAIASGSVIEVSKKAFGARDGPCWSGLRGGG